MFLYMIFQPNKYKSNTYRCTISNLITLANANKNGSTYIESRPIIHTPSHPHRHIHLNTLLNSQHILTHPTIQFHSFTTNQYLLYVEEQSSASSQKCTRYTHVLCTCLFFQFIIPLYCCFLQFKQVYVVSNVI